MPFCSARFLSACVSNRTASS